MPDDSAPGRAPQFCPTPCELDDLELLIGGGYAPLTTFGDPVGLALPEDVAERAREAGAVELVDPEGLPLARVSTGSVSTGSTSEGWGAITPLATPSYGPFRRLHLTPAEVHERWPQALVVPVVTPLGKEDLEAIRSARSGREVVLLALSGHGTPQGVTPVGLIRTTLAAAHLLGHGDGDWAHVVAVPLPSHGDAQVDHDLGVQVVENYAPTGDVLATTGAGDLPEEIARLVEQDQPDERGVVVFFTGLSGSGKSTLARALLDHVLEDGRRTVTSLDGDVVRRHLSAGLTFSKQDRETNIRRIGWVAAEIARHHGIAICSPIAPFDATRKQVRQMVEDAGGEFVLVHVATPLEECERRDRKGLYAKARAGEIPEFTGISSPYEEPDDATVRVDTTGRSVEEALADVLAVLPFEVSTGSTTVSTGSTTVSTSGGRHA
ncbi:MAG TPA: adenylyl-sulfate kinase [Marmoricola sp.]|nr:adenylyl-sulfate kinase [Marmoricola sp.]